MVGVGKRMCHLSSGPTACTRLCTNRHPSGWIFISFWEEGSQHVHLMFPTRTGARAAQKTSAELHHQDDEYQEPVEKHCGSVCQLVSVLCLYSSFAYQRSIRCIGGAWVTHDCPRLTLVASLRYYHPLIVHIVSACLPVQPDRVRDPPLLCPKYDGPRGPAHCSVPRRLLHNGWHRRGNLPGPLPCCGVDGTPWRSSHLHDHNSAGVAAAAGSTKPWVNRTNQTRTRTQRGSKL